MVNDWHPVSRQADIQFDCICAERQGMEKSRQRVFGCKFRRAPVGGNFKQSDSSRGWVFRAHPTNCESYSNGRVPRQPGWNWHCAVPA